MIIKYFSAFRKCLSDPVFQCSILAKNRGRLQIPRMEINTFSKIEENLFNNWEKQNSKKLEFSGQEERKSRGNKINAPGRISESIKPKNVQREKLVTDTKLGLEYLRRSEQLNPMLTAIRSQKQIEVSPKIIIEGRRLIKEALRSGLHAHAIVFSQKDQLVLIKDDILRAQKAYGTKLFKVSTHELKMWSTLTTPPGILAVFDRPTYQEKIKKQQSTVHTLPITVVCDNIREPRNLGSIIRTCAAVPCDQVILTKGCCDPWESKALRGGCGGHFNIRIQNHVSWEELDSCIPKYEESGYKVFIAENNLDRAFGSVNKQAYCYNDLGNLNAYNVVIIGGESHGVGNEAYRFLESNGKGRFIYIPVADGMDSLNVASALTLILYEFRCQILKTNVIANLR